MSSVWPTTGRFWSARSAHSAPKCARTDPDRFQRSGPAGDTNRRPADRDLLEHGRKACLNTGVILPCCAQLPQKQTAANRVRFVCLKCGRGRESKYRKSETAAIRAWEVDPNPWVRQGSATAPKLGCPPPNCASARSNRRNGCAPVGIPTTDRRRRVASPIAHEANNALPHW